MVSRPADISKAYGGGRTISREEMQRMDEEFSEKVKVFGPYFANISFSFHFF